jgi:hypothetical protein
MLQYTHHAIKQMIARSVSDTDVQAVLRNATVRYEQSYRGSRQRVHQHGDLAVVTDLTNTIVVTVLFNRQDDWSDEDVRNRP